jgi:thioredoxin-related protein
VTYFKRPGDSVIRNPASRLVVLLVLLAFLAMLGRASAQEESSSEKTGEAAAPEVYVPLVKDLQAEARLSRERHLPMLVMFASETCTYCQYIDKHFLKPMIISGKYNDKVLIRVIYIDSLDTVRDFSGKPVPVEDLAASYHVKLTPTVLFLGPNGEELAPRMIGISSPDFYGTYLDQHIDQARAKLSGS